jgi:hypothetical protein
LPRYGHLTPRFGKPPSQTMTDMIAGLCVVLLLAALYAVRRGATQARRKLNRRARSQQGRTLSARTEMRACASASTTQGMLKKRSRHASAEEWKRA